VKLKKLISIGKGNVILRKERKKFRGQKIENEGQK
jgi:hypothetical protein